MDEATKRVACRMIAGLVATDEDFSDSERLFLDKVLQQFGIPESEWDAIFPLLDHDAAEEAIRELDPAAQKEIFELLIEAALVDGTVAPEERAYIDVVGGAIGLVDAEIERRLSN
jgi:uncharacterized tellurite resistance protein B-like protein